MFQLKEERKIDHNIVSVYSQISEGAASANSSFVKFGGWDQKAIADGHELQMFKTINKTTWNLQTNGFKIGNQTINDVNTG